MMMTWYNCDNNDDDNDGDIYDNSVDDDDDNCDDNDDYDNNNDDNDDDVESYWQKCPIIVSGFHICGVHQCKHTRIHTHTHNIYTCTHTMKKK